MKKAQYLLSCLSVLTFFMTQSACKKTEDSPSATNSTNTPVVTTPTTSPEFAYSENGSNIVADSATAVLYTTNDVGGPRKRKIDVYAFKSGKQVMEFHFKPNIGAQTVLADFENAWLTFIINNGLTYPGDYFDGTSGNFNLTVCDTVNNSLTGTFNFVGSNGSSSKSITAGSINLLKLKKQ